MRLFFQTLVLWAVVLILAGCATVVLHDKTTHARSMATIPASPFSDIKRTHDHLFYLASDALEGRYPGTLGHDKAVDYLVSKFTQYGLSPAGENGFLQPVKLRTAVLDQQSPFFIIDTIIDTEADDAQKITLDYPAQFVTSPNMNDPVSEVYADVVFVGYGLDVPEFSLNSFAGVDVEGKIMAVVMGKPDSLLNEEGAHLSSGAKMREYAEEAGAIGVIYIVTPTSEIRRPFKAMASAIMAERMTYIDKDGAAANASQQILTSAVLSKSSAESLFVNAPVSLQTIFDMIEAGEDLPAFDMNVAVSMGKKSIHNDIISDNVVAMVEGSDPQLKDEFVVYSAHFDHLGISKSVEKDRINNGAFDNAIGTAVMLETARLFAQMPIKPKRSMLFVAVTAEEKGLLGSDYFARYPTVPLQSMVANVNLDMPLVSFDFADVIAFGSQHSQLGSIVARATEQVGFALTPDPWPQLNLFTRSDHYSFVKQGVPSIFLVTGVTSNNPEDDAENALMNFLGSNYHKPSDDLTQFFHWGATDRFTQVNYQIGLEVANSAERPKWFASSFFGKTFGRDYNTDPSQ